jgi:protein TonB
VLRNRPSHPRACADLLRVSGHPQDRRLAAAIDPTRPQAVRWLVGCLLIAPLVALAQTPASTDAAQDRSQKQSDSVYRWIKMHSEPVRKPEAPPKPRPKAEPAPQAARKPEAAPATSPVEPTPAVEARMDVPSTTAVPAPPQEAASAPASVATAPATPAVVEAEDMDLRPISQPQPEIPRELRTSVVTGRVMLSFTVQTDGTVAETTVVRTTNRRLAKPALDAVSQWRFEPIRTARAVQVEIEFNLQ